MRQSIFREDHVCPHGLSFMLDNPLRRLIQPPRRILNGFIREGDTAVDLGCGPGFFTLEMARMVGPTGQVVAVDLQPEMLARLSAKAAPGGKTSTTEYAAAMSKIRVDNLEALLSMDRARQALIMLEEPERLGYLPRSGSYYLGEAYRRSA